MLVQMALFGLVFRVRGGGALCRFGQRGAVEPVHLPRPAFQLDVGREGRGRGGRGGLQETAVVEEAEDSAALLSEGVQDEAVLYSVEETPRGQRQSSPLRSIETVGFTRIILRVTAHF